MKNKKNEKIIIIAGIVIVVGVILAVVLNHMHIFRENKIYGAKLYEKQVKQEFTNASYAYNNYKITSEKEYKIFNEMYSNPLKEKINYKKDTLFVQTYSINASGIKMKLDKAVVKDKKLEFKIKEDAVNATPTKVVTWYFVAVIPNNKLKGVNLSNWYKPSTIKNNN